jgi:hypothetical protein
MDIDYFQTYEQEPQEPQEPPQPQKRPIFYDEGPNFLKTFEDIPSIPNTPELGSITSSDSLKQSLNKKLI